MVKSSSTAALSLQSFLASWAMMRISGLHSMNVIAFLFFFLCLIFLKAVKKETALTKPEDRKRQQLTAALLGLTFTLFYLADIRREIAADLDNALFKGVIVAVTFVGLFLLFENGILYLLCLYNRFTPRETREASPQKKLLIRFLPLLCFLACVFCRIPFLLYSWPGILTPDSINQLEQVMGMQPFSNHHPWVHTMTISLFYHLGTLFTSSVNGAFAFYTLFQICFMALAAAYLVYIIGKSCSCLLLQIGIISFYALMPYNSVMAICIWKDVLFAGTLLFFCTALFHLLFTKEGKPSFLSLGIYTVSGCLMCLYRSNGWYAFLLGLPFLLISFRKQKKLMYPIHLFILLLVLTVKGPVMEHYEVKQPDFVESVSIPLQQVCRVVASGKQLTDAQEELLSKIMDISYIDELYTEYISDNMKELVRAGNPKYLEAHKGEYLKLWLGLGFTYPDIYLDAYIEQTKGYYSPTALYPVADVEGVIDNDTGLHGEYLIGGKLLTKLREISLKLQNIFPLYGALWSLGSVLWLALLALGIHLSFLPSDEDTLPEKPRSLAGLISLGTPWIPNMAIIATLLIATPVAVEFRYAYHLVYSLPLYCAIPLIRKQVQ